jgi:hypothetical protein
MDFPSYQEIYALEAIHFIGGTEKILEFAVFDESNNPIDLEHATCTWKLCYFGQNDATVMTKAGIWNGVTAVHKFTVVLTANDTRSLEGKFIQQPIIVDQNGSEYHPAQGLITIIPANS